MSTFNGDPLTYHSFIKSFDNSVDRLMLDDCVKLTRLAQYCTGGPKSVVEGCMSLEPSTGYAKARETLRKRYGNRYKIAKAWIDKILE